MAQLEFDTIADDPIRGVVEITINIPAWDNILDIQLEILRIFDERQDTNHRWYEEAHRITCRQLAGGC